MFDYFRKRRELRERQERERAVLERQKRDWTAYRSAAPSPSPATPPDNSGMDYALGLAGLPSASPMGMAGYMQSLSGDRSSHVAPACTVDHGSSYSSPSSSYDSGSSSCDTGSSSSGSTD